MKKPSLAALAAIYFLSVSQPALASNQVTQEHLTTAREFKASLEANFERDIRLVLTNAIDQHFSSLILDASDARGSLVRAALTGTADSVRIAGEQSRLMSQIAGAGSAADDATIARAISAAALQQSRMLQARRIAQDEDTLVEVWRDGCKRQTLNHVSALYDPLAVIKPAEVGAVTLKTSGEIRISYSMNGNGSPAPVDRPPIEARGGNGSWLGEYAAPAMAIGVALIVGGGPIGIIAGSVIVAVVLISELIALLSQSASNADIEREVHEISVQTMNIQLNALRKVSGERTAMIERACAAAFVPGYEASLRSDAVRSYLAQSTAAYEDALAANDRLRAAIGERYNRLTRFYFPALIEDFTRLARARQEADANDDASARTIVRTEVAAAIETIAGLSGPARWEAQQAFWSRAIQMDARYRNDDRFSIEADEAPPRVTASSSSRFWSVFGPRLKEFLR